MKRYSIKLLAYLKSKGVSFKSGDNGSDNVIFSNKEKEIKISYHCFYRFSGPAVVYKTKVNEKKKDQVTVEAVALTPELFYNLYMKQILNEIFNIN